MVSFLNCFISIQPKWRTWGVPEAGVDQEDVGVLPQRFPGRRTGQESLPRPNHRIGQPGTTGEIFGRRRLSYGTCAQSRLCLCTIKICSSQIRWKIGFDCFNRICWGPINYNYKYSVNIKLGICFDIGVQFFELIKFLIFKHKIKNW